MNLTLRWQQEQGCADFIILSLSASTEELQLQNITLIIGSWCLSQWNLHLGRKVCTNESGPE